MLVLTRKQQQQIQIGDNITLTILKVKGQSVRVGVEAPRGVRILRGELVASADLAEEAPLESTAAAQDDGASSAAGSKQQTAEPRQSLKRTLRRMAPMGADAPLASAPR